MYKFVHGVVINVYRPSEEESHALRVTTVSKEPPETFDGLRALIFDLDDILYPLDTYVQSGFRHISSMFPGEEEDVYELLWQVFDDQLIWGAVIAERAVRQSISVMLREYKMYSDEMLEKYMRIYEQHDPQIRPYDETEEWLQKFRDRGLRLGMIVSGPPQMQRAKLKALGIEHLFDEIILTDEIAGNGDVRRFRLPSRICFDIMSLRLEVPLEEMRYVSSERYERHLTPRPRSLMRKDKKNK